MSALEVHDLEARILSAVQGTPGVTELYRPGGVGATLRAVGAKLAGTTPGQTDLIRVDTTAEGTDVEVSIGIDTSIAADETARAVHAAVLRECEAAGLGGARIRVTVVHVSDGGVTSR